MRKKNVIYFDRKTKRFKKNGRFVSLSSGLKSKHAREQYYKRYPSRRKKPVKKQIKKPVKKQIKKPVKKQIKKPVKKQIKKPVKKQIKKPIRKQQIPRDFEILELYEEGLEDFELLDLTTSFRSFSDRYFIEQFESIDLDQDDAYSKN